MAAKRLNLCSPVRAALNQSGISTVRVVNAVNSALGQLEIKSAESKTGDGTLNKTGYKVTETVSTKYVGTRSTPLEFDAWHSAIAKANKIAEFKTVAIPGDFANWLLGMKATEKELAEEIATS